MNTFTGKINNYRVKFVALWRTQVKEVDEGGPVAFLRKMYRLCLVPLALCVVILIRLLRPFVSVRLRMLVSGRIGSFSFHPEMYLCNRDLGRWIGRKTFDIFYYERITCNHQLMKMWSRVLRITRFSRFMHLVDVINKSLPGCQEHVIPWFDWDNNIFLKCKSPHLFFTPEEKRRGDIGKKDLGIPQESAFVCFTARDSAYLNTIMPRDNFYYHNYRNCSIQNYLPAMEKLTKKGYFAVRMGVAPKEPLVTDNPMIIDYAAKYRNDFMDIYLSANCRLFVSSSTGIDDVPRIFRNLSVMLVNFIPLGTLKYIGITKLFIPKKLWSRSEGRLLGFREIFDSGIASFNMTELYDAHGIEVLENTPEEITAAVLEAEGIINGTWREDKEGEELQRRFWALSNNIFKGMVLPRIGTDFLRCNRELLA